MMYCFINSNLNFLLALAVIAGNLLLLVAALYFAAEALRSQSKVVVAYLSGRADALEEVLKGFQEKQSDQRPAEVQKGAESETAEHVDSR